jgi:putative inorganic carbon (hco3(-)) transporter
MFAMLAVIYLLTLASFMFRVPELQAPPVDRIMFVILAVVTFLYFLYSKQILSFFKEPIFWPMFALTLMAFVSIIGHRFNVEAWSAFANKLFVPYSMFFIARTVFKEERPIRYFFFFALLILVYLVFISIAFLLDVKSLVYPSYINDESFGIMADRARGPFLQAVANGTSIIFLGLVVFYWFHKRNYKGLYPTLLLFAIPIAIIATMTRAIWLSFLGSIALIIIGSGTAKVRRIGIWLTIPCAMTVVVLMYSNAATQFLFNRLTEQGPVDFRFGIYTAGFEMFKDHPIWGWGFFGMSSNIWRYITDFSTKYNWAAHNTYLEILVEYGLIGFIIYGVLIFYLFRLGSNLSISNNTQSLSLIDVHFILFWRIILLVYLINGMFVVMNYQFINALLFTIGGIVSALEARMDLDPDARTPDRKKVLTIARCNKLANLRSS